MLTYGLNMESIRLAVVKVVVSSKGACKQLFIC